MSFKSLQQFVCLLFRRLSIDSSRLCGSEGTTSTCKFYGILEGSRVFLQSLQASDLHKTWVSKQGIMVRDSVQTHSPLSRDYEAEPCSVAKVAVSQLDNSLWPRRIFSCKHCTGLNFLQICRIWNFRTWPWSLRWGSLPRMRRQLQWCPPPWHQRHPRDLKARHHPPIHETHMSCLILQLLLGRL